MYPSSGQGSARKEKTCGEPRVATFILIHGGNITAETWNRLTGRNTYPPGTLMGAKVWDGTKAFLESHGNRVFTPTLADEHTHMLSDHIDSVCSLISTCDLHTIILVGHSYGGMVITGVAARMPDRIRQLIYVDAALPDPGESLFDQFEKGGVDPLSFAGLEPAAAYVGKVRFDSRRVRGILKTYVLCTKSEFATVTRVAKRKVTEQAGWSYLELPTSHVPMATMPRRFYRLMGMLAQS